MNDKILPIHFDICADCGNFFKICTCPGLCAVRYKEMISANGEMYPAPTHSLGYDQVVYISPGMVAGLEYARGLYKVTLHDNTVIFVKEEQMLSHIEDLFEKVNITYKRREQK